MQPYEADPHDLDEEEDYLAWVACIAQLTDEDVRSMGCKEVYPGYFEDDPRHPFFSAEDRYLMDHHGPDWKTKPKLQRNPDQPYRGKGVGWDEEQLFGQETPVDSLSPRPAPKIVPLTFREAEGVIKAESHKFSYFDPRIRQSGIWICRICRKALALWPSERALRLKLFGLSLTLVFRSPLACTNCRIFEHPTIQKLGREDHRRFWNRIITEYENTWDRPWKLRLRLWRRALGRKLRSRA